MTYVEAVYFIICNPEDVRGEIQFNKTVRLIPFYRFKTKLVSKRYLK